jgi:hypothetical protein
MFSQNIAPVVTDQGLRFTFELEGEIKKLYEKYGGMVNVKIGAPSEPGTEEQNRAMHALLSAYYVTGMHSAPEGYTLAEFKIFMKLQYGPSSEIEYKGQAVKVPKSWAEYSKRERMDFIDALISEIHQSGAYAESEKIREIISGMELKGGEEK